MPPRRRTPPPIDVDDLRSRLDQGKIVRVAIAHSAQFPEGTVGRVRSLGDPAVDGDEFIHVELSVNGTKDLLPFAPADLTVPTRASAVRNGTTGGAKAAESGASAAAPNGSPGASRNGAAHPAAVAAPPGEPLVAPAAPAPAGLGAAAVARAGSNGSGSNGAGSNRAVANGSHGGGPAPAVDRIFFGGPAQPPAAETAARPTAARPARSAGKGTPRQAAKRRGPAVAITIGTSDTDPPQWRLEAKVGAKVVVRHGSVAPTRVWELVGLLGDETLSRAVGTVLDEQRQAARSRADALAAELAAVQAELAELPEPTG